MIRKLIKASVLVAMGLVVSTSYAQETSTPTSKLSFELLIGNNNPEMDITVRTDLAGLPDLAGASDLFTDFIPKPKSGVNFGIRGNYSIFNNISAYGQFGYSNNSTESLGNVQNMIEPLLGLLSLVDLPVDVSDIRVNMNQDGNYNMISTTLGLRYDYTLKEKFNFGVYAGFGYYNLSTPGATMDLSATIFILPLEVNNIISLDQYSDGSAGWQTGANITYNVNDKFYVGVNAEYNEAKFDYSSMEVKVNEENIPELIASFSPIDLSLIPDFPLSTKIDLSSFKYGLVLGMHL